MTKHQIEVITSVERRRRWSREEEERLVAATFEPGASVSEIARSASLHVSQLSGGARSSDRSPRRPCRSLFPWRSSRRSHRQISRPRKKSSTVTIELGGARRPRIESDIDSEALGRILDVLERR
ncbi:transposase [Mesorhizobium sp. M0136]|uniref:transposase n=1 Tax=Mesorhizobium sp. M0136 TaxID=2956890 RepID=UPI00333B8100